MSLNNLPERHETLGFFAHPGTLQQYLALIVDSVQGAHQRTVFYHNLHSLYCYFTNTPLRESFKDRMVLVDGMPLIWLLQLMGRQVSRAHRLTYVDFIMPMMQLAQDRNYGVFHVGQSQDIQKKALKCIREAHPGIRIDGHDGYFDLNDPVASRKVIAAINSASPDLVLIGFGTPKQELWLQQYRDELQAPIVFTCGACMEYVAGAVRTPPRWMGRCGLEWSFRLLENPRRFAFRYCVEPAILGIILARNGLSNLLLGNKP